MSDCCGPILEGTSSAPTAEALMRSRYTAFVVGEIEHLRKTLHPRDRDGFDAESARRWSAESEWLGLEIRDVDRGAEDDDEGVVEFVASYVQDGAEEAHHEIASFRRVDGRWCFVDGKIVGKEPFVRAEPKVGRNDPCPCGSGKKFKKCCGK
jgi:SEC-C motif-containing protein